MSCKKKRFSLPWLLLFGTFLCSFVWISSADNSTTGLEGGGDLRVFANATNLTTNPKRIQSGTDDSNDVKSSQSSTDRELMESTTISTALSEENLAENFAALFVGSQGTTTDAVTDSFNENHGNTKSPLKVESHIRKLRQPGLSNNKETKPNDADNIRFLSLLPLDTVSNVPSVLEGLDKKNPKLVADFANKRPSSIVLISTEELNKLLLRSEVLKGLNQSTIDYMIMSEELAVKLEKLPKRTIAKMIAANPNIAASFPTRRPFPARSLTERLLHDREFLEAIPVQIHAYLAETEFRHLITPEVITIILASHPNLPYFLGPHGRKLVPKLIRTNGFLDRAPCATIINIAVDIDMINSLGGKELTILSSNKHVWQCLPIDVIRNLMRKASIGNKLVPSDLWEAVKVMTSAKGLDSEVVINLLRYQFPDFAASNFG